MDVANESAAAWSLRGTKAHLNLPDFAAQVDLGHPELGLLHLGLQGTKLPANILEVARCDEGQSQRSWPLPLVDSYVRGNDVVASYGEVNEWPYAPQIYWRANTLDHVDGVRASLSIMLSMQTHLLDTHPQISIASKLANCESLYFLTDERRLMDLIPIRGEAILENSGSCCCVLHRVATIDASYIEIVPTSDFRQAHVRADVNGNLYIEWQLFADFLEKGVIRRARVHSAWLPRERDVELALECCTVLEQAPLPLTA